MSNAKSILMSRVIRSIESDSDASLTVSRRELVATSQQLREYAMRVSESLTSKTRDSASTAKPKPAKSKP